VIDYRSHYNILIHFADGVGALHFNVSDRGVAAEAPALLGGNSHWDKRENEDAEDKGTVHFFQSPS
jgi:hypothetical protein